jgi:wyosine [tRNA(Phe)-imidazoG37] synthetase (radical SAM superfamily)
MTDPALVSALRHASALPDAERHTARAGFRRYATRTLRWLATNAEFRHKGARVEVTGFAIREHRALAVDDPRIVTIVGPQPKDSPDSSSVLTAMISNEIDALCDVTMPRSGTMSLGGAEWSIHQGPNGPSVSTFRSFSGELDSVSKDFVFAYPTVPQAQHPSADPANAATHAATVVSILLDVVDLVAGGRAVAVDEIALAGESAPIAPPDPAQRCDLGARLEMPGSGSQPLHTVASTEPTIVAIARHWGSVAGLITLRPRPQRRVLPLAGISAAAGQPTAEDPDVLDGFALRELTDWLIDSEAHPSEVYEYLARVCNVACSFCYLFGNPDDLAVARGKKVISADEMDTRLKYFDPIGHQTLFKSQWEINEFLVDPKLPSVLRALRAVTDKEFYFITNGSPLLPRVIELLDEVRPVTLIVSTNTVDGPLRSEVMNERRTQTETALSCLRKLSERRIPFGLSFVATPDLPVEKMVEALDRIEPLSPAIVRVNLPGFTRAHPYQIPFDAEQSWERSVRAVAALRERYRTPIVIIPSAYECVELYPDPAQTSVIGTVPGSPAAAAGLRPGDIVRRVGFLPVGSRAEVQSLVMLIRRPTTIVVERNGETLELLLDPDVVTDYPYSGHLIGKYVVPYGLVVAPSISRGDVQAIARNIEAVGATTPWLITSALMQRQAGAFVSQHLDAEKAAALHYTVVDNDYLGGNIQVLDMATVSDIYAAITRDMASTGTRPDLVLLPGTGFNSNGRDISGVHWGDLERALNVPVRLLDVTTQFVF